MPYWRYKSKSEKEIFLVPKWHIISITQNLGRQSSETEHISQAIHQRSDLRFRLLFMGICVKNWSYSDLKSCYHCQGHLSGLWPETKGQKYVFPVVPISDLRFLGSVWFKSSIRILGGWRAIKRRCCCSIVSHAPVFAFPIVCSTPGPCPHFQVSQTPSIDHLSIIWTSVCMIHWRPKNPS